MGTSTNGRRRILHLLAAGGLLLGLAATMTGGLASCSADKPAVEKSRPLNKGELERLAGMRARNFADGRVGLRGTIGPGSKQTKVDGWVDWKRQLVYLSVAGTGAGAARC
ncbi:hypothetical protein ACFQZ4_13880 [Catellatospora coxensis]